MWDNPNFCNIDNIEINDVPEKRDALPAPLNAKMNLKKVYSLLKTIVGKDLSKYSLPVFLNEPISLLQKTSEAFIFCDLLEAASKEKDRHKRMVLVSGYATSFYWVIDGRIAKPFKSILGETYELVTNKFKFYGENVS